MHIVIITHSFPTKMNPIGGNFIPDLAKSLKEKDNIVKIIIPGKKKDPPLIEDKDIKVYMWMNTQKNIGDFKMWNIFDLHRLYNILIKAYLFLKKIHGKRRIDFIFVPWAIPQGIPVYFFKLKFKVPYGVWALGSDINRFYNKWWGKFILKKILTFSNINFANSYTLCKIVENITSKKCEFLSSLKYLKPSKSKNFIIKKKREFIYIYVGRLEKVKGVDVLIKVAIELFKKQKNTKLLILGEGNLKKELKKMVKENKLEHRIIFKGIVPHTEINKYLKISDCLILPSRKESMPNAFWEALQTGVKVIGTDVGDLGKRIREYRAGITIPPENPKALYKAMLEVVSIPPFKAVPYKKLPTVEKSALYLLNKIKHLV